MVYFLLDELDKEAVKKGQEKKERDRKDSGAEKEKEKVRAYNTRQKNPIIISHTCSFLVYQVIYMLGTGTLILALS